ncbi:hypothetical protein [Flagellimonas pacifica]|nr:hypothetical protein [Allomuricauda parva]
MKKKKGVKPKKEYVAYGVNEKDLLKTKSRPFLELKINLTQN